MKKKKKTIFDIIAQTKINTILIITVIIIFVAIVVNNSTEEQRKLQAQKEKQAQLQEKLQENFEKQTISTIKSIQNRFDIGMWKDYETRWYGFKIKYPQNWKRPVPKVANRGSKAEYRYEFRMTDSTGKTFNGFDVIVYNINTVKELSNTDEFPTRKEGAEQNPECETIGRHLLETGDYAAEEIYIPGTNNCYNPSLFFSVTQGDYIYNLVPKTKTEIKPSGDPLKEISDNVPEFFVAISTFDNIDIVRPKPKPTPATTAPMPVAYKRLPDGRLVCEKDNDKPKKSKKNKGRHLDMECCLDPDEYPNPHCYYDPKKYGKYL